MYLTESHTSLKIKLNFVHLHSMINLKENILYISFDGMTDPLGQSQVLPYLSGLSKNYTFHLISFEKPERFKQQEKLIRELCEKNNIEWHPIPYSTSPKGISNLYNVRKMIKKAKELEKIYNFKIIHCRSYISALVGLKFKQKHKKKFLFDMRGFWADERIDGGIWNLKNPIHKFVFRFFKKKEKAYFQHADAVVSLTKNGKKEILSWNLDQVYDAKIAVIPCCVNLDLFDKNQVYPVKKEDLKKQFGIQEEDYILGYVGSVGTWYMLPEMLDYFKVLSAENEKAKFLFVTAEPKENILSFVKKKGIAEEKILITKCLHKDVPTYISLFDSSIFFIQPVYSKKASSPTKQGELMAMGIPVVCNSGVGDTDHVVNKYESGILVEDFTSEAYKKAVLKLRETTFDVHKIKQGAKEFYGLENGVEQYCAIYKRLLNG